MRRKSHIMFSYQLFHWQATLSCILPLTGAISEITNILLRRLPRDVVVSFVSRPLITHRHRWTRDYHSTEPQRNPPVDEQERGHHKQSSSIPNQQRQSRSQRGINGRAVLKVRNGIDSVRLSSTQCHSNKSPLLSHQRGFPTQFN